MPYKDKKAEPIISSIRSAHLRRRAEEAIKSKQQDEIEKLSPDEMRQMLHELRVHQIELEMQNEELRQAQVELDAARARYFDLYDLAPVGYISLSDKGLILEGNLTASNMLGVMRNAFAKQPITRFIAREDQEIYYLHRKKLFETSEPQECELRMKKNDGTNFWARMEAALGKDADGASACRVVISDITERKKLAERLEQSEIKYRNLFKAGRDPLFLIDKKTREILDVSDAAVRLFGYTREELLKLKITAISAEPEETEKAILARMDRVENRISKKKDGTLFPIDISLSSFTLENREVVLGAVRDMTERRRMEEELRQSEELYRKALLTTPDAILVTRLSDGMILMINNGFATMTGYGEADVKGKTTPELSLFVNPEDRNRAIEELKVRGELRDWEILLRVKDGEVIVGLISASTIELNGVPHILVIVRDITEWKKSEEKLGEMNDRLNLALSAAKAGVWDCDLQTGKMIWDDRMLELYGLTRENFSGSNEDWEHGLHPEDALRAIEEGQAALRGELDNSEFRILRPDGSVIHIKSNVLVICGDDGKPFRMIGLNTDITDRKQAEVELKRHRRHLEDMIKQATAELEVKSMTLQESNTALKVLLKQREDDKKDMEERFLMNIQTLVMPHVEQMKKGHLESRQQSYLDIVETHIKEIASPLLKNIQQFNLTPREVKVATLIKQEKSTKEIAEILGLASGSIDVYRKNLRKKLGLNNRKVNLLSFLKNLG
jgi:PAS domain S-box-containing protein